MKTFSKMAALFLLLVFKVGAQGVDQQRALHDNQPRDPMLDIEDLEDRMTMRHRGGNGGDSIASQFITIAHNAAIAWEAQCEERYAPLCDELDQFKAMLDKNSETYVKVLSAPNVDAYDSKEREAVNFYDDNNVAHIIVGEEKWLAIGNDYNNRASRKVTLVLHEYFSLMGIESSDFYNESSWLYTILDQNNFNMEMIASKNKMPSKCSMHIRRDDSVEDSLYRELKSHMGELNFTTTDLHSDARYLMKATLNCDGAGLFQHACSVYIEVVDQIKKRGEISYSDLVTGKKFGRKKSLINNLLSEALGDIAACQ